MIEDLRGALEYAVGGGEGVQENGVKENGVKANGATTNGATAHKEVEVVDVEEEEKGWAE